MNKGDSVKINLDKLIKNLGDKNTLEAIQKFDKQHNGIHEITDIFYKNPYSKKPIKRIELDNDFVFYESELIR